MENGSLTHMMKQLGSFPELLVAQYMTQALKGLQFLHENSIMHRDIKGSSFLSFICNFSLGDNLLISKDGRVCLADFGLATKVDVDAPPPDDPEVVGTPYWRILVILFFFLLETSCS